MDVPVPKVFAAQEIDLRHRRTRQRVVPFNTATQGLNGLNCFRFVQYAAFAQRKGPISLVPAF